MNTHPHQTWRPLLLIMLALAAWGAIHAVGAYLFDLDYRKPVVVYAFMGAFLASWAVLLALRGRRQFRSHHSPPTKPPKPGL